MTCIRMSAVQPGARSPGPTAAHSQPAQGVEFMGTTKLLRGSGQVLPGRDPNGRHSKCRFRIGAAGFAAAFPADFPALRF